MMVSIYALLDPRDGRVRYVGQTKNTLAVRLSQHIQSPTNANMRIWLESLQQNGMRPVIIALAMVDQSKANDAERRFIRRFKKRNISLLNASDGVPYRGDNRSIEGATPKIKRTPEPSNIRCRLRVLLAEKAYREHRKPFSLREVAAATGLTTATVSGYVNDTVTRFDNDSLAAILGFLRCCTVKDLIVRECPQ